LGRDLEPNVVHALDFLISLRDQAGSGPSVNGRYGLLAPGFADGGIGGICSEFINTEGLLRREGLTGRAERKPQCISRGDPQSPLGPEHSARRQGRSH
jgi:hypothetical protein